MWLQGRVALPHISALDTVKTRLQMEKHNLFKYSFFFFFSWIEKYLVLLVKEEMTTHIVIVHQFWRVAKKTPSQQFPCSYCCGCQFRTALRRRAQSFVLTKREVASKDFSWNNGQRKAKSLEFQSSSLCSKHLWQ